jgi:leader peptidase (prepilin peptidase)/N-methyltransferase
MAISSAIFDSETWAHVPFHFWTVAFFTLGAIVGSFLNVCIHRMPLEQSIVSPPSHCPHCNYSIPWYLNIPLVTWLYLKGKCANCGAPISVRYWLVELLTALVFMVCWLGFGHQSAGGAIVYSIFLAALIVATFIDIEHFIIPDEITLGGTVVGLLASFLVPALHWGAVTPGKSLGQGVIGALVGAGAVYAMLRLGKLLFGMRKVRLEPATKVYFTETALVLPGEEISYQELLYRPSDTIKLQASIVELCDRCYRDVSVRLSADKLMIGDEELDPNTVTHLEATTGELRLPREAMGLGDVKFMAMIGAFLGWQAVLFSFALSAVIGTFFSVVLILAGKQSWSRHLPYGPYIAAAAAIWVFGGQNFWRWWLARYLGIY